MLVIMNYNAWFHNQHRYHKGSRDGVEGFNDTKWANINERFRKLIDMESELLTEQPFMVNGNNTGFDKLIDLMGRSNYTFEDLDKSMRDTYRISLQNAMSRNLVNTHAVMFHTNNIDQKNVSADSFTHYRIIDAPFNQLHFGHRDEFIRQKLIEMHTTEGNHYVDISKFNSSEFVKILDFSIICTVNGYFCNDCKVAIDDKGFKFKVGWPYASDVDFIVYKLDHSRMYITEVEPRYISDKAVIPYSALGLNNELDGVKCIVNIYDKSFVKTSPSVPNFGVFTKDGLMLRNLQKITVDTLTRLNTSAVSIDIYAIKFFHEIPNLYPAINYIDIMDSRVVYDEKYEHIKTPEGHRVVSSSTQNINYLERCTPPISIDRDTTYSFDIIVKCLSMHDEMMKFNDDMISVGQGLLYGNANDFKNVYKPKLVKIYQSLLNMYKSYQQGAIITSLVPGENIDRFLELITNINRLATLEDFSKAQQYVFPELYEGNYRATVSSITEPFHSSVLSVFSDIADIDDNYFTNENSTRFNRPISEECFMTLRYHHNDECWLFDYPKIKHFHGIGNTFYIDSDLKGNEIFKFFVLYSDTESPAEPNVEHFDLNTVLDFDIFSQEVDKHIGCIRYWDAENRLLKLTEMLYNKYDDETCVQVLSKILKRKLSGDTLIKIYPSDINYEDSNSTTDNLDDYTENSERGPFSINFLFYTLSMLNNNEDRLQAYFYRHLTNQKFNNRYSDIDISSLLDGEKYPLNYSEFSISPSRPSDDSIKPTSGVYAYYGLPLILSSSGSNLYEPYRYVLNVYDPEIIYPMISENSLDPTYYTRYDDIEYYGGKVVSYHDNVYVGKLMTLYLSAVYDYISDLQTNYRTSFNQSTIIESANTTINQHISNINDFVLRANIVDIIGVERAKDVISIVTSNNDFLYRLNNIKSLIDDICYISYNNSRMSLVEYINSTILGTLKYVYVTTGFDNLATKRTRMLYIHLKKINTAMNPYQYKKWLDEIDIHTLGNLDDMLATNENYNLGSGVFKGMCDTLNSYMTRLRNEQTLESLDSCINDLTYTFQTEHIDPITEFCDDIINKVIFDLYTLGDIKYDETVEYNDKPAFVVIDIPDGSHTNPPIGTVIAGSHNLIFQPIIDKSGDKYVIKSLVNICEYVFFNGEPLTLTMNVIDVNGRVLASQQVSMEFIRTSSTADKVNTFFQIPNTNTSSIEFQNPHESFDIVNDLIVNEKHADMNYEMLIGNHFTQLDHEIEYILEPETWLPGSVDKLYIENQLINRMSIAEFGHRQCSEVYFKPAQVFHIEPKTDGSIDSIFGKYFEGQTIYLKTTDGIVAFPVKITTVDHSINKGFIEAKVDGWNSKWFKVTDSETITKYLKTNIECEVIDDNMRNFLDEFSNGDYPSYSNPGYSHSSVVYDENIDTAYKLPGDPIFVSSNSEFIYNRLNWIFNEIVPNRFIDDEHKKHKFIYVTSGFINNEEDVLKINMINHDFNKTSLPERYPVLRDEPNDHEVWSSEMLLFSNEQFGTYQQEESLTRDRIQAEHALSQATTVYEKERCIEQIEKIDRRINRLKEYRARLELYKRQLETPSTWFNVRSFNAALVYIANGRADRFSPHFVSNIRDILYTDKVDVFLYDWEHKLWLDPKTYEMETEIVDNVKIGEYDDYTTNRVLYTFTIKPKEGFTYSKKLLVYFSYNTSDIFDEIEMNAPTCSVRFKPVLSLDTDIDDYNPYSDIRIRKHFDGYEKYTVDGSNIHVKRVKRNGKYVYAPTFRVCDIKVSDDNGDHTFDDISEFLVPNQFGFDTTQRRLYTPVYDTTIHSEIDSFVPDREVKLICISNNENSSYDGNISSVMFNALTSYDENGKQHIEIIGSTLSNYVTGNYICTVFQDDGYEPVGGVITVRITNTSEDIFDEWIRIPLDYIKYREVPNDFKIVMKQPTTGDVTVTLENHYIKTSNDVIDLMNGNINNPFEYYYDHKHKVRMPISDVRINSKDQRLVIDTNENDHVKLIKAPYVGICRFSLNRIPEDGLIDLTGYIPTPLTRDRYEFWINGRCIKNKNDLIILSPTSIQLCNMRSLKNFEVIELVDDINTDNDLFKQGTVYVDLNGNSYSTYRLALLSNNRIRNQDIRFVFNTNVHKQIHDHTKNIITKINNKDIEEDILSYVTFDETVTDYNKLYNIPSINGISLFHPKLQGLGISEIPNYDLIKKFDEVWKYEAITNPLFITTHRDGFNHEDNMLKIHIKRITEPHWNGLDIDTTGMYLIYATGPVEKYFSLYISKKSDGLIDDVNNTIKIIPFITTGVYVLIDSKYKGLWLHSTHGKTKPIHIVSSSPNE